MEDHQQLSNNALIPYVKTNDILCDMCGMIDASQEKAYHAVNLALVRRNWLLGLRIAEEVKQGELRAEYGACVIGRLSRDLSAQYGKGFTKTNLLVSMPFIRRSRRFSTQ